MYIWNINRENSNIVLAMSGYILILHYKFTVTCFSHTKAYCNMYGHFRQFNVEYLFINVASPDTLSLSSKIFSTNRLSSGPPNLKAICLISTYFTFRKKNLGGIIRYYNGFFLISYTILWRLSHWLLHAEPHLLVQVQQWYVIWPHRPD